jgi:glutathione S-transferase
MKLHWSPRSPFVRKVMIVAHELGLVDRLDCVRTVAATTRPHPELMRDNPLSKIPTLLLDDGSVLYDSRVICEYLDGLHAGRKLFPIETKARMTALRRQALGDGALDFLLLLRNERERAQPSPVHVAAYSAKKAAVLDAFEREADDLAAAPFDIGHIGIGGALCYLDFRYASEPWRDTHPKIAKWHADFCARPSVRATEPVDDS